MFKLIIKFSYIVCLDIILLSGAALINNFLFGQFYLLLLMLIVLDYYLLRENIKGISGMFWGIGASIKYFPLIFAPILIVVKKTRVLYTMIISIIVVNTVALFFLGVDGFVNFYNTIFVGHLNGNLSGQSEYSVQFQSWNSFFRNLFVYNEQLNRTPLINSNTVFQIARAAVYIAVLSAAGYSLYKIRNDKYFFAKSISLSSMVVFVLSPASASYHLILMIIPVVLLLDITVREENYFYALVFMMVFVLIGFAQFLFQKINPGLFFSYYRLWLVTILFSVTAIYLTAKKHSRLTYP